MKTNILRNIFLSSGVAFAVSPPVSCRHDLDLATGYPRAYCLGRTNDGILKFNNTPLFTRNLLIPHSMLRARVQVPARHNPVRDQPGRNDLGDATPTRAVRFTLIVRTPDGRHHRVRRSGRGKALARPRGLSASTRRARRQATTPTRAVCFTVSCALRTVHHNLRRPGCGHRSRPGYFAGNINRRRRSRDATLTRAIVAHGSCALRTAQSLRLMLRTRAQGPGQGTFCFTGFLPSNPAGRSPEASVDASDVYHGFLRAPDGTITTFDPPGVGQGPGPRHYPSFQHPADAITGYYIDANDVSPRFPADP